MNFEQALDSVKNGFRIKRKGWNASDQWVFLCENAQSKDEGDSFFDIDFEPFLVLRNVQGNFIPWLASQSDLLADDWQEMENPPPGEKETK